MRGPPRRGNLNTIRKSVVRDTGGVGIHVDGDFNDVSNNRVERSCGASIETTAASHSTTISRNLVRDGESDGLLVGGTNTTVSTNTVEGSLGFGMEVVGSNHLVSRNLIRGSGDDGVHVSAISSRFERNSSKLNNGFGIEDTTVGGGTSGTANTYVSNTCSGNTAADSSPPKLCQ